MERGVNRNKRDIAKIKLLDSKINNLNSSINTLEEKNDSLEKELQQLQKNQGDLSAVQNEDRTIFNSNLQETNTTLKQNQFVAVCVVSFFVVVVIVLVIYLWFRKNKDTTAMGEVRKAQDMLKEAQIKLQEDSVGLDNKMVELLDKQINSTNDITMNTSTETDHSLALKVADEIVRIEMNLSRMDSSIKGFKQLSKAVERIRNNFQANGYEIVDMLGKPYNAGMRVIANFVPDDTLDEGVQKITGVIKPQINYKGVMIQKAQVTVSQNI